MPDSFPWILLSGIGLILIGYKIWHSEEKESLLSSADPSLLENPIVQAGLDQNLVPLYFVPDPLNPRRLTLEPSAVKALQRESSPSRYVIHHAAAVFGDQHMAELGDYEYSVNGEREGSVVELKPSDEEPAVVEADTRGAISAAVASYRVMKGIIVFVQAE